MAGIPLLFKWFSSFLWIPPELLEEIDEKRKSINEEEIMPVIEPRPTRDKTKPRHAVV